MTTINDVTLPMEKLDVHTLLGAWSWLIGDEKLPIAVTKLGDAFVQSTHTGEIFYLNVVDGKLDFIAIDGDTFMKRLADSEFILEHFGVKWMMKLKKAGVELGETQVYAWRVPPILGGEYKVENVLPCEAHVYFSLMGQVMQQIADVPDGEKVQIRIVWDTEELE